MCTLYYPFSAFCDAGSRLNNFWQIAWDPLSLDVSFVTNHLDQPEINLDLGSLYNTEVNTRNLCKVLNRLYFRLSFVLSQSDVLQMLNQLGLGISLTVSSSFSV